MKRADARSARNIKSCWKLTSDHTVLHSVTDNTHKKHALEKRSGGTSNEVLAGVVHDLPEVITVKLRGEQLQNGLKGIHFQLMVQ